MVDVTIRKATSDDLEIVRKLVIELAIFEKEPHAVTANLDDYVNSFNQGLIDIIIAECQNEACGMVLYYESFSTWKGKMLYLEDFIVKQSYRKMGLGSQLFDAFIDEAHKRSCKMVKWQVLDWNEKAIKFYEKRGATIEKEWLNGKIIF